VLSARPGVSANPGQADGTHLELGLVRDGVDGVVRDGVIARCGRRRRSSGTARSKPAGSTDRDEGGRTACPRGRHLDGSPSPGRVGRVVGCNSTNGPGLSRLSWRSSRSWSRCAMVLHRPVSGGTGTARPAARPAGGGTRVEAGPTVVRRNARSGVDPSGRTRRCLADPVVAVADRVTARSARCRGPLHGASRNRA